MRRSSPTPQYIMNKFQEDIKRRKKESLKFRLFFNYYRLKIKLLHRV